jgi:hypothetical protein
MWEPEGICPEMNPKKYELRMDYTILTTFIKY